MRRNPVAFSLKRFGSYVSDALRGIVLALTAKVILKAENDRHVYEYRSDIEMERTIAGRRYIIRRLRIEDFAAVFEFADKVLKEETTWIAASGQISEHIKEAYAKSPSLSRNVYVIEHDGRPVGLIDYSLYFNHLQQELTVINELIVIQREHRSLAIFIAIIELLQNIALDAGVDRLVLAFDNAESPEQKRQLAIRLGFEETGAILFTDRIISGRAFKDKLPALFSWCGFRHIRKRAKCNTPYLLIYIFTMRIFARSSFGAGTRFLERCSGYSYIFAQTIHRNYDGAKAVIVHNASGFEPETLSALSDFAKSNHADYVMISLIDTYEDAKVLFPNYTEEGYRVAGYVLSKMRAQMISERSKQSTLPSLRRYRSMQSHPTCSQ